MTPLPLLQLVTATAAQADLAATTPPESVWDYLVKGGPMMFPIGACSLVALCVIIERLVSLRRAVVVQPGLLDALRPLLARHPADHAAANAYCTAHHGPVAEILGVGVRRLGMPLELLERHLQEAGQRAMLGLRKHLRFLSVIASIAPLLGLLGTILGLITAFRTVASSGEALGRTELLAAGIYEAMITTAAGLLVAIPALLAYHGISGRIDRLAVEIEQTVIAFIEEFALNAATATPPAKSAARVQVEVPMPTDAPAAAVVAA